MAKVLWIEDQASEDVARFAGPVYASAMHDLVIAKDASTAMRYLQAGPFDAVIVDIRIDPGDDAEWVSVFRSRDSSRIKARLGLELLCWLFGKDADNERDAHEYMSEIKHARPDWTSDNKSRFGVFTVETKSEIGEDLHSLGIICYERKHPDTSPTVLMTMIGDLTHLS